MVSVQARAALVARLERELERSPRAYRFKLALLATLGYVVLGTALFVALALSVGLLAVLVVTKSVWLVKLIKVAWIPLVVAWMILRALWVRILPPQGERVTRREAPALIDEIERLRLATGAPRLTGVVIDADLNAAAVSVPRLLGLLGHRHWLVIGLPLMQALNRDQFASVIAHEFGHFGRGHGRFAGWIYRVRVTWYRLLDALAEKNEGRVGWLQGFFAWYAPYFNAYSFALARSNEYEADGVAARVSGKDAAGQALLRINLAARRLSDDFWPGVRRSNRDLPQPPSCLYSDMASSLATASADDTTRLRDIMALEPGLDDTHPVPAQRLAALGVEASAPAPPTETAATVLLGDFEQTVRSRFSQQWSDHVGQIWRDNHEQAEQSRSRLSAIEAGEAGPIEGELQLEHAELVESERGVEEALSLYRRALEDQPSSVRAHFQLGRLLLGREDVAGVALLRRALALDERAAAPGLELLAAFHARRNEGEALAAILAERDVLAARWRQAQIERGRLGADDELFAHGLDADVLRDSARKVHAIGAVAGFWIARKRIVPDGGVPHFVLLVKFRWWARRTEQRLQAIANEVNLPGSVVAINGSGARNYAWRLRQVAGPPLRPLAH